MKKVCTGLILALSLGFAYEIDGQSSVFKQETRDLSLQGNLPNFDDLRDKNGKKLSKKEQKVIEDGLKRYFK